MTMRKSEVAALLAIAAGVDNREPSRAATEAWLMVLELYDFENCRAAVAQFRREQPGVWLEPGHLCQIIDQWEREWSGQGPMPVGGQYRADQLAPTPEALADLEMHRRMAIQDQAAALGQASR
jgi:hypothetical protein